MTARHAQLLDPTGVIGSALRIAAGVLVGSALLFTVVSVVTYAQLIAVRP